MAADDLLTAGVGNINFSSIFVNVLGLVVTIGFVGGFIFFLIWLYFNVFNFKNEVELFSVKGKDLVYFGDDRAKKVTKDGVDFIQFRKNRGAEFINKPFPASDFLIRKRLFGTKIKAYLKDGELVFFNILFHENPGVVTQAMSVNQKLDYTQRMGAYKERYGNKQKNEALYQLIGIGAVVMMFVIGGFFLWQMFVAQTEMVNASVSQFAALVQQYGGPTQVQQAPG